MFGKVKYLLKVKYFIKLLCLFNVKLTYLIRYLIRPKVLVDVSNTDLRTTILGQEIAFPICASPTGVQCLAHPDGENAAARGIVLSICIYPILILLSPYYLLLFLCHFFSPSS